MGKEEVQKNYTVTSSDEKGQVQISNEVVTIIAGLAATEVKGVASMVGNITNELVSKLGIKNLSKGVKIAIENDTVNVDLALNLDYGFSIPKTCGQVQEKVKTAIESMTGLKVENVNIKIANVTMENGKYNMLRWQPTAGGESCMSGFFFHRRENEKETRSVR